jgi:hypothetical protein
MKREGSESGGIPSVGSEIKNKDWNDFWFDSWFYA